VYKSQYKDCLEVSATLNNIIQDMNSDLTTAAEDLKRLNLQIAARQADLVEKEVEIQKIKSEKTPWYRHPIAIGLLGLAAGVWIAK
jgi:chromosome segregation ATPase